MVRQLIILQWKSFFRSASVKSNLIFKIIMAFAAIYFAFIFIGAGIGLYFILKENNLNPIHTVSKYIAFYFVVDLIVRFFFQNMPSLQIKPLLTQNINKNGIVHFTLGKTILSFFNFIHWFFFIPFVFTVIFNESLGLQTTIWALSLIIFIYCNNFLAILIDKKDAVFYSIVAIFIAFGLLKFYAVFDITPYFFSFFILFFNQWYFIFIPLFILATLYWINFNFFKKNLYLDQGLAGKITEAKTENLTWLDQWGTLGTFLKNDIRLIKRNKRARTTVLMSVIFIFYGLLFFTNSIEAYNAPVWKIFAGIFVSGGFLLNFGQFVPSWDSSYYPLMMTQNVSYREYLASKWWLMVLATVVSTLLASFYLYFGWQVYLAIVVGAIFNIGVNASLVMLGGAFVKTPIDLTSAKNAFGDKKAFNFKTFLISMPKIVLPMIVYAIGHYTFGWQYGYILVALTGILGFLFKQKIFKIIEKTYQKEKYKTLEGYKQK